MPLRPRLLVLFALLAALLLWSFPRLTPAAAASDAFTPLFLGSLNGSASPNPSAADQMFTALATHATTSIDIALYDFNRASVRDALIAAKGRGLTVRVVGDNDDSVDPAYQPTYNAVQTAGIPVVTDTKSSLMHNKFAVFDNQVTWTGSVNFSDTGFTLNGENAIVITSTVLADIYHTEFNELFGGAFSNDKTDNTTHTLTVGSVPVEVAFAPTDGIEQRIINAINSADKTVQVTMFTFTNQAMAQALMAARQRGVAVEVILDSLAAGSSFSQRDPLCAAGVTVHVEDWDGKLHDKYAIVDAGTTSDPLILTGSTNWTSNAVTANDENLLIVHDGDLVQAYTSDFTRLRSALGPTAFACNVAPKPTTTPIIDIITPIPSDTPTTGTNSNTVYLPIVQRVAPQPSPTPTPSATSGPIGTATRTSTPSRTATNTPQPTPTLGTIPAPSGVCAQNAPSPAEGAQAWMTVVSPSRRSNTTLCVRLIHNGQVVVGAPASGTAHYKTTNTSLGPEATGSDGVASITFNIGGATSGYTVDVDAQAVSGGVTYRAFTSFTPQ